MHYMIIANEAPEGFALRNPEDQAAFQAYMTPWMVYSSALKEAGISVGSNALEAPETATCIRVRNDKREVQDGPFAETREQLGGYFIIDVDSLEVAKEWAAKCPAAVTGSVEIRKIADLG